MSDEVKKQPWYDNIVAGLVAGALLSVIVFGVLDNKMYNAKVKLARQHIETVTATDKNCNDCHLGASFVNLFNNPVVKGNDNTVNLMMDKAKIKRW